jgi:hypothetical protein
VASSPLFNRLTPGVQPLVDRATYVGVVPDESAPPQLPDAPSTFLDDREVERWLDQVAAELQRVLDAPPAPLAPDGHPPDAGGPRSAPVEPVTSVARREADTLRTWSRREADAFVDETRRQVLEIYERLRLGVADLTG